MAAIIKSADTVASFYTRLKNFQKNTTPPKLRGDPTRVQDEETKCTQKAWGNVVLH